MIKPIPTAAEAYGILLQKQVHQEISKSIVLDDQDYVTCRVEKTKSYDNKIKGRVKHSGTKR